MDKRVWNWRCWQQWQPDKAKKAAVGSFPEGATPEGVCDLVGYMDEMCSDWYHPEYYADSPEENPRGPSEPVSRRGRKDLKVTRGGLTHLHEPKGIVEGALRSATVFGVLPRGYLPRGWSREFAGVPDEPRHVFGRLGFRVVVDDG